MTGTKNFNIKDAGLSEGGKQRIDWAYREMPVVRTSRTFGKAGKTLAKALAVSAIPLGISDQKSLSTMG